MNRRHFGNKSHVRMRGGCISTGRLQRCCDDEKVGNGMIPANVVSGIITSTVEKAGQMSKLSNGGSFNGGSFRGGSFSGGGSILDSVNLPAMRKSSTTRQNIRFSL